VKWQPAFPDSVLVDYNDGIDQVSLRDCPKRSRHPIERLDLIEVSAAEQNKSGSIGTRECEQTRVIEVCSDNDSGLVRGAFENQLIGCSLQTQAPGMNGVVTPLRKPVGQRW
jgi:hypothetical protein